MIAERPTTMWSVALQCLRTAEAADWRDGRSAKAAWNEVEKLEMRLLDAATTLIELGDKLRYLLGLSELPEHRNAPLEKRPWKQQLIISAIEDIDRMAGRRGVRP